jgi:hypothetical protein
MKYLVTSSLAALCAVFGTAAIAQQTGPATGTCKDNTSYYGATKSGACRGHGGVKEWFAEKAAAPTAAAPAAAKPAKPTPVAAAPAAAAATPVPTARPAATAKPMPTVAAAGGGAGQVWVNLGTKVYHCANSKWYGKTKQGQYMSESQAQAQGAHADHGKTCS